MNGRALQSRLVVTPPSSNALTGSVFLMGLFVIVKMTAVMRRMRNIVVSLSNIGQTSGVRKRIKFYVHNFKEKQKKQSLSCKICLHKSQVKETKSRETENSRLFDY